AHHPKQPALAPGPLLGNAPRRRTLHVHARRRPRHPPQLRGGGRAAPEPAHACSTARESRCAGASLSCAGTGSLHAIAAAAGLGVRVAPALRCPRAPPHVPLRAGISPPRNPLSAGARNRLVAVASRRE